MSLEPDSAELVWEGKLLGLTVEQWGENEREIVEHPGAVAIVAVDGEGHVALVRQLREATREYLLELPAGTAEPGEEPLETAKRELREECGLTGGRVEGARGLLDDAGLLPRADASVRGGGSRPRRSRAGGGRGARARPLARRRDR